MTLRIPPTRRSNVQRGPDMCLWLATNVKDAKLGAPARALVRAVENSH